MTALNDDDVRAVLAAAIERNSGLGGNGTVLRLARIGRELMRQRDARSEDFLRMARELTAMKERLRAVKEHIEDAVFTDDAGDRLVHADDVLDILDAAPGKEQ